MSIKKNFIYNLFYNILIIIIPLITMPYLARVIGIEGVGAYSYTFSIANYFVMFAMLGLNNYGNRAIANVRDNKLVLSKTFWNIYSLQFLCSLLVIILYSFYVFAVDKQYSQIFLVQGLFVISAMFDINWLFFGLEKLKLIVIRNTIIKISTIILIFMFVKTESDLQIYTLILAASFLLSQLLVWPYLKNVITWITPSIKEILKHIKPNLILFIPVISISIYKLMDKVMIGNLSSISQLAFFENAEKINSVQIALATALGMVMLPRMSNLVAKGDKEKSKVLIRDSMQFVMFLSVALCFGIIAVSNNFIPLFLGNHFSPSSTVLILLAPTGIFIAWANVIRTQYLIPNYNDKTYVGSVILGAVVNLVSNLFLIPILGASGAAIGTIIAEFTVMIYQTILVRNSLNIKQYFQDSVVFIPIGVIMLCFIKIIDQFVGKEILGILIQVFLGALIYLLLATLYFLLFNKNRLYYFIMFTRFSKRFIDRKNLRN